MWFDLGSRPRNQVLSYIFVLWASLIEPSSLLGKSNRKFLLHFKVMYQEFFGEPSLEGGSAPKASHITKALG